MATENRAKRVRHAAYNRQRGVIVLEDIGDEHNARAVFRSADAFGFQRVHLVFVNQEPFEPQGISRSTSMSAVKWLDFRTFSSTEQCMQVLRTEGCTNIATALTDDAQSIYETDLSDDKVALWLGNEKRGLSDEALALADKVVRIPMMGMMQSLNLSVSAAVCMFEITRQRNAEGMDHYLLDREVRSGLEKRFLTL